MIWDLIQLLLLIALVIVYTINLYMHNVMLRDHEKKGKADNQIIGAQKKLLEVYVEERELWYQERYWLYEDVNALMGEVLDREKERDYWKNRALSLQREVYQEEFFKEE